MRYIGIEHRAWLARRAEKQNVRRLAWLIWKRDRNLGLSSSSFIEATTAEGTSPKLRKSRPDPMPAVLCLDDNYEETLQSIEKLQKRFLWSFIPGSGMMSEQQWYPDFTSIERITPVSALLIGAELDRARRVTGKSLSAINFKKWHPKVREVVRALDFLSLLDLSVTPSKIKEINPGVFVIPIIAGTLASGEKADHLTNLVRSMTRAICSDDDPVFSRLQSVIVEGMENTALHAYDERYENDVHHSSMWWLTGSVDLNQKRMTIAICDQGATIPVTLPHSPKVGRLRSLFNDLFGREYDPNDVSDDHLAIQAAMEIGASATGLVQHGKGLPEFKAFVDSCHAAKVRIASRHGEYTYSKGSSPRVAWHPTALKGTLVEWDVFL